MQSTHARKPLPRIPIQAAQPAARGRAAITTGAPRPFRRKSQDMTTDHKPSVLSRVNRVFLIVYYAVTLAALAWCIAQGESYRALQAAVALVLPAVPPALQRIFRLQPIPLFALLFNAFVFCAVTLASALRFYDLVPFYDKILHFFSGVLICAAGFAVYCMMRRRRGLDRSEVALACLFALCFAMASAVAWEIYEYVLSLFGPDPQMVALTGVTDTMLDMILCTVGALVTVFFVRRSLVRGAHGRLSRLTEPDLPGTKAPEEGER